MTPTSHTARLTLCARAHARARARVPAEARGVPFDQRSVFSGEGAGERESWTVPTIDADVTYATSHSGCDLPSCGAVSGQGDSPGT